MNTQNKKRIGKESLRSKFPLKAISYKLKADRAFVSMMALMLANIFLIIGMSVFSIALREIVLSSGSRESLFAFYAADGGMECALYWDIQQGVFSTSTAPASDISCSGQDLDVTFISYNGDGGSYSRNLFDLAFPEDGSGTCVQVNILKNSDGSTVISSSGRNTCDSNSSKIVERTWRVSY
ncbi:MAG: hypothetical protein KAS02_01575 [Candidatus Pacebacteria bacterium]|nr:hypothetical protein [Candidatus Paceibacterota bacterium]